MINKYFKKQIFILLLFINALAFSQSIPSSLGTALCSTCAPNANWTAVTGTPDVSNSTTAATAATSGGGATWNASPLPLPPNGHNFWISLRDIGSIPNEEVIRTTITGLTVGREYEVLIYSLSATAPGYSPVFIDSFDYQLQGAARVSVPQVVANRNTWVTQRLRFTAVAATRTLTFYPGSNGSTTNFESINISVTLNAINAVPIAVADNVTTNQNTPVTINVSTNDSDPDGSVVANTVRFANNQTSVVVPNQGTWSVNTTTGVVTFTPLPTFVGTATIPYTIKDNFVLDGVSNPSTSNSAIITATVLADTDSDGIPNTIDLDDDNDGILDVNECQVSNFFWSNPPTISGNTATGTINNINYVYTSSSPVTSTAAVFNHAIFPASYNVPNVNPTIQNTQVTNNTLSFATPITNPVLVFSSIGSSSLSVPIQFSAPIEVLWSNNVVVNSPTQITGTEGSLIVRLNGVFSSVSFNYTVAESWANFVFGADFITNCDTDSDGIPDSLDLDSDGDGCFDAVEGDENVTRTQLNANGSINTVANGGVNANGVPNLVNAGGIADIGSDVGQGLGTSKNAAVQDIECSTAIGCTGALYLSQSNILYSVNTSTNPFTYPQVGLVNQAGNFNAIGISPINGRMYATSGTAVADNNLYVINANGTSINLGPVTNLPAAFYNAGEVDNLGNYYVKAAGVNDILYRINVTTLIATPITLSTNISVADLAFRTTNGLLYTVSNDTGQLLSINPTTGAVTGIGTSPGTVAFGALFGSSTGEIYGSDNAGGFYQFNLTNGQRVQVSASPASGTNDGAHCVTTPIAFSADLAITKTDNTTTYAPGSTRVYTIVARNNGPFGVLGATVSDPLPTGILAANVSYTAVAAGGATTSVVGTQTGAINDVVNLPVNATVTYTVTVSVPFAFTGDLVNTVTITAPANSTDSNLTNNTATDTDTQAVCYKPGATGGTVLNTNHGITSLNRAGSDASGSNWPMVRKGAWTALESRTKGFVVNRLTTFQISQIPAANLVEGMMVYNTTLDCLQVNTTGTASGWACFNTPTCPSN